MHWDAGLHPCIAAGIIDCLDAKSCSHVIFYGFSMDYWRLWIWMDGILDYGYSSWIIGLSNSWIVFYGLLEIMDWIMDWIIEYGLWIIMIHDDTHDGSIYGLWIITMVYNYSYSNNSNVTMVYLWYANNELATGAYRNPWRIRLVLVYMLT